MAEYNPNLPDVAGNEWVPIVPSPYAMGPGVERGYSFSTAVSTTPFQGQYFLQAEPPSVNIVQVPLISIYPTGQEDTVGEIKTVVVPVDGAVLGGAGNGSFNGPSAVAALQSSSDPYIFSFNNGAGSSTLTCSFDTVTAVIAALAGKRILNVSILYTASGAWGLVPQAQFNTYVSYPGGFLNYGPGILESDQTPFGESITQISRLSLGEIDLNAVASWTVTDHAYPWRSTQMLNWDASAVTPLRFVLEWNTLAIPGSVGISINYLAMEVTYCEETRVLYGGAKVSGDIYDDGTPVVYAVPGVNYALLRTSSTFVTGSSLAAGNYTITSCLADLGDLGANFFGFRAFVDNNTPPIAQALRQLYPMVNSPLRGVELDRALTVNETFDSVESDVLPYIAFNTAFNGNSHLSTHAYGQPHNAAVYTGHSVRQSFNFATVDATPYPYLRYYARKFGNGTCTAGLTATLTSNALETVTLSCATFNALPEIADGWKEITLLMPVPATLATGADSITWSSTVAAGEQWQILANHGQSANLSSNFQTLNGFLEDPTGTSFLFDDATFYFMQTPPTVSGVGASVGTLPLTPIGLDCGTPANCVPTGMSYAFLSWSSISSTSPSASGTFGAYEVERQDDADSTWQLIARLTSIANTAMFDVEPRVGMASRYRVRMVNIYDVPGAWSSTVTANIPAVAASLWLFTSNHALSTVFAAPEVGPQAPNFQPKFPEGDSVTLQEQYNRDYVVAFHGTERGGERFGLTLMANQGAVSIPNLDDLFTNFRDLAWDDVPHVTVRDWEGNRWFANVQVPDGNVRRRRGGTQVQLVGVRVIEVQDIPTPLGS
jgi:hypothetical protein